MSGGGSAGRKKKRREYHENPAPCRSVSSRTALTAIGGGIGRTKKSRAIFLQVVTGLPFPGGRGHGGHPYYIPGTHFPMSNKNCLHTGISVGDIFCKHIFLAKNVAQRNRFITVYQALSAIVSHTLCSENKCTSYCQRYHR